MKLRIILVTARWIAVHVSIAWLMVAASMAQQPASVQRADAAVIIRGIDAAVQSRAENVLGFTAIEHYAVYRGGDQTHPAAEMTVRDTYKKGVGKSYTILSQSGSDAVLKFGLHPLLENEERINAPANVSQSWFISTNYEMKLQPGPTQWINGRACYAVAIKPRREAPNMVDGTIWVDTKDYTLVKVQGVASKSPSIFAGTTHMMREYVNVGGYSMAMHAHADSDSMIFGRTVVMIDYRDYQLQTKSNK